MDAADVVNVQEKGEEEGLVPLSFSSASHIRREGREGTAGN